ncbi:hypothetical protein [Actinophytocola sp.]|nr:hypothetical protein [Actinophytocola sp.]HYQ66979.1 hypothetical protein [Actinophytocola sp.]
MSITLTCGRHVLMARIPRRRLPPRANFVSGIESMPVTFTPGRA